MKKEQPPLGFSAKRNICRNLSFPTLYEESLRRFPKECYLSRHGSLVVYTGEHTGRSPNDKYIVLDPTTRDMVWWGKVNQELSETYYGLLEKDVFEHLSQGDVFVFDGFARAGGAVTAGIRVVSSRPWAAHFAQNMFLQETGGTLEEFVPDFTIYHAPDLKADQVRHGTRSGTFIVLNLSENVALIGGTKYAGEIKKTVFTFMNWMLSRKKILSMHCSANYGKDISDSALFFGLSGTGKTTLSADPKRILVGDDEHGWDECGVFNIENGCYAKVIHLSKEGEPEIFETTRRFGTILENVDMDMMSRELNLESEKFTENTRGSYPVHFIPNMDLKGVAGHPRNIIFLSADAFGILPPVARLTGAQALYYYISGYTAKVAGTEIGVKEPQATFSPCFGGPFLPAHPNVYAELLLKRIETYKPNLWLVNTGWVGGPYGVGERMKLFHTRKIIDAILSGSVDSNKYFFDPIFKFQVMTRITGVPHHELIPKKSWANPDLYHEKARALALLFQKNFEQYKNDVSEDVRNAGPIIAEVRT